MGTLILEEVLIRVFMVRYKQYNQQKLLTKPFSNIILSSFRQINSSKEKRLENPVQESCKIKFPDTG